MLRARSPGSISVVTSFFVVRALRGAVSVGGGASALGSPAQGDDDDDAAAVAAGRMLSRVSATTLARLQAGAFSLAPERAAEQDAALGRQLEYLHCLLMNAQSPVVKRVVLLVQDAAAAALLGGAVAALPTLARHRGKIVPVMFDGRRGAQPLYSDLFAVAQRMLHPTDDVAALCNSDIHLHTTHMLRADVHAALPPTAAKPRALALTRYEEGAVSSFSPPPPRDGTATRTPAPPPPAPPVVVTTDAAPPCAVDAAPLIDDFRGSHDAFLFRPGHVPRGVLAAVRHAQNAYQAENVVAYELQRVGLELSNPSRGDFRVAHKHASEVRQWFPPVADARERYSRVEPTT
jgi:hypothetical protein